MKIAIAVGIILNAGVLSVIAYQQNQQTAEQGSQVVALLKQLERPEPVQEPEEDPLAGKIDKLVAVAERAEQREVEGENPLAGKIDKLVALAESAEQREVEQAKAAQERAEGQEAIGPKTGEEGTWEYKVIKLRSTVGAIFEAEKKIRSTISVDLQSLKSLGNDGWELATSYVEHETVFPNFGNPGYVPGIKPNTRPSAVVFVFKRKRIARP